jgi:hypothetical protein
MELALYPFDCYGKKYTGGRRKRKENILAFEGPRERVRRACGRAARYFSFSL